MTQIIRSLSDISDRYDAVFCDLWGCLHNGKTAYPAAVEALRAYRAKGGIVVLLTNSPRPKPSVIKQLEGLNVPSDAWDDIATSGDAAQYALFTGAVGRKIYHLGPDRDSVFFTQYSPDLADTVAREAPIIRVPLTEAEGIVCTGLFDDQTETPNDYRATLLFAKNNGLKMLCANPDLVVDLGDKRIFCAGAIAQAYDAMGGQSLYFGKPHPPIYDLARRRLSVLFEGADPQILCIGDGIATDIQGGLSEGLDTLFITAGLADGAFGPDSSNPDKGLLDDWLDDQNMSTPYAMGHLR